MKVTTKSTRKVIGFNNDEKGRQLLARVPFSMQPLKMEESSETNYIN